MYCIQTFRRHTEYIPNVRTPIFKIYCTAILLRSHITAVSPTTENHFSLTSTPYHQLEGVWKSVIIFSKLYRYWVAYATYNERPLKHWDDKKMNPSLLVRAGILPT